MAASFVDDPISMFSVDVEVQEAAKALGARLVARTDAFGVQNADGSYTRVSEPMKMGHLVRHVLGEISIGHYLIEPVANTCKVFAFDIDADKGAPREASLAFDPDIWARMLSLAHGLASWAASWCPLRPMVSYGGGKGLHVICPVRGRVAAADAGLLAQIVLADAGFAPHQGGNFWKAEAWPDLTVEVFPKQHTVEAGGFGNLMRLPLGRNAKTGNLGYFIPAETMALGYADDSAVVLREGTWRR